jgi:hypothetical protein
MTNLSGGLLSAQGTDVAVLREAYRAFNAREMNAALATMRSDVDWPNGMDVERFMDMRAFGNTGRGSGA